MESEYAFIKNQIVENIALFDNPTEELLDSFKQEYNLDSIVAINGDENCFIGSSYDGEGFIKPKPYNSWLLNSNKEWVAPVAYPIVNVFLWESEPKYAWDEESLSWVEIPNVTILPQGSEQNEPLP